MAKKKAAEKGPELVGTRIFQVIGMGPTMAAQEGLLAGIPVIVLENGISIFALSDPEGNGAGALFGSDSQGDFHVYPGPEVDFLKHIRLLSVGKLSPKQMQDMMWDGEPPAVLEFEGNVRIFASRDNEGNGPGTLIASLPNGKSFYIFGLGPKDWSPR